MADLSPGILVHHYRVGRLLGRGGMGSVYEAVHAVSGERVALKTMHAEVAARRVYRKRFLREARAAMAVPHVSIVKILEVFEHDDEPMIAMEMLDGESLEQLLRREGKLPLDRVARIFVHVTSALGTAHALGIVHRDLKPDNIFLTRGAPGVKVLDFGIAKLTATEGEAAATQALTETGATMGTPTYMSPEQVSGEKKIDQRADIWSLGIILYRCLSGVVPTKGGSFGEVFRRVMVEDLTPVEQLVPGLPAEVVTLVRRMLTRPRDQRPWDLREVHAVLERHAGETAPSFQEAVLPAWDEATSEGSSVRPAPAGAAPSSTIALTPGALVIPSPSAVTSGGTVVLGDSPTIAAASSGSIAAVPTVANTMAPAVPVLVSAAPAPSQRSLVPLVAALVVAVIAAVVLLLKLRG